MTDESYVKVDILLNALEHMLASHRWQLDRAQTILSWIASLLLATAGFLAILGPGRIADFGLTLRIGLTAAVCGLFIFAWISQLMTWKARVEDMKSAAKIAHILHFFKPGYFDDSTVICDEKYWTRIIDSRIRRWGVSQGTAVLLVLATVAIAIVWTS